MTKKEISTKLEIAEILVKHLNCETSEALTPIYDYLQKQLIIQRVTFCLPIEGDTFVSWHSRHFKLQVDGSVVAIKNETIKYTQDQMLELWNFLTDRLLAN